jgi:hypothetical protein
MNPEDDRVTVPIRGHYRRKPRRKSAAERAQAKLKAKQEMQVQAPTPKGNSWLSKLLK